MCFEHVTLATLNIQLQLQPGGETNPIHWIIPPLSAAATKPDAFLGLLQAPFPPGTYMYPVDAGRLASPEANIDHSASPEANHDLQFCSLTFLGRQAADAPAAP